MDNSLAVVPIFVNAGAAILPAIIAAAGSVIGVLLRPRELVRLCRRRPGAVGVVLAGIAVVVAGVVWLGGLLPSADGPRRGEAVAGLVNWNDVATRIIQGRKIDAAGGATTVPARPRGEGPFIYRDNASRSGYDGGGAPLNLMVAWPPHGDPDTMVLTSPAVIRGMLFGATCGLDVTGNYGSVFCLDAKTGRLRWAKDEAKDPATGEEVFFNGFFSSPAVTGDGKYVVIGQGLHADADCALLCFEAESGKLHWRVQTPLHIEGSPAVLGDLAVAGAGAIEGPDGEPMGNSGFVLAVRISDGRELWRFALKDPESSPVIGPEGTCYIGSGMGGRELVALRTEGDDVLKAKGRARLRWRAATPYPATGAVTLAGDLVIVGCGRGDYVSADPDPIGTVIAFNRHTGARLWDTQMPDAILGAVAAGQGKVICPVRNGEVVALDLGDGKVIWRQRVNGDSPVLAGPALAGDVVYAVSCDGTLAVIDAREGKLLEKTHYINDPARPGEMRLSVSAPIIAGGRLYVGSETGGLRCMVGTRGDK